MIRARSCVQASKQSRFLRASVSTQSFELGSELDYGSWGIGERKTTRSVVHREHQSRIAQVANNPASSASLNPSPTIKMPTSERTPLLWQSSNSYQDHPPTPANNEQPTQHAQFLMMTGTPSSAPTPNGKRSAVPRKSLYGRASRQLSAQRLTYYGTASLSNAMLLGQVMIGAALTALGASQSSHILITVFGAMNTIIAGLVAYLKSRGQPMRARMYRDDLERVVDEIENSEVMWLGEFFVFLLWLRIL